MDPQLSLFVGSWQNEFAVLEGTLDELFKESYEIDLFTSKVLTMLSDGTKQSKEISLVEFEDRDKQLSIKECSWSLICQKYTSDCFGSSSRTIRKNENL